MGAPAASVWVPWGVQKPQASIPPKPHHTFPSVSDSLGSQELRHPASSPRQAIATRGILSPPQTRGGDGGSDTTTCVPEGSRPLRSTPLASPVQGHVALLILHGRRTRSRWRGQDGVWRTGNQNAQSCNAEVQTSGGAGASCHSSRPFNAPESFWGHQHPRLVPG